MEDAMREVSSLMSNRGLADIGLEPKPAKPEVVPEPTDMSTMDPMEFGLMMTKVMGGSKKSRPADRSSNDIQVDLMLGQADRLAQLNDQYTEAFVVKGNKALYELLTAIYSYALQIDQSPLSEHILQRMRQTLEEKYKQKTQANTHWMTTVLRFILPRDRQTAFNYSRVLQVAYDEDLTPEELPEYIKEAGGITKITQTKEQKVEAEQKKLRREKSNKIARGFLLAQAKVSDLSVKVPNELYVDLIPKEESESYLKLGLFGQDGNGNLNLVRLCRIGEKLESKILEPFAAFCAERMGDAQGQLDRLRAQHGITHGFGMEPSDKGYKIPGSIDISAEERIAEIRIELEARDRELAEARKALENKSEALASEITIPVDENARAQQILEMMRKRKEEEAAQKLEMEREPSE